MVLLALEQQGVSVVGEIPAGQPVPVLPRWGAALIRPLAPGALLIALVSWLESSSVARTYAVDGDRLDPQGELWALGAANTATGLVRAFPGASGLARTAVNHRRPRAQLSGVVAALVLLVSGRGAAHDCDRPPGCRQLYADLASWVRKVGSPPRRSALIVHWASVSHTSGRRRARRRPP